jgi:hypothetical protein
MAYLDIIPLADAKVYLRIDDTLTEDDAQITRMIKGALSYIERTTNVMLYARDVIYNVSDNAVKVYDYPINSEVANVLDSEVKSLYTNYTSEESTITLNVGYVDVADVPQELIEVAYVLIKNMYYEKENNKTILDSIDSLTELTLSNYKRFIL